MWCAATNISSIHANIPRADATISSVCLPSQYRHANDEMSIDYTGDEIEIGFNVNYLLEALKACQSNNINLGLLDPNTSCTFHAEEDEDTLYLIMPMRL